MLRLSLLRRFAKKRDEVGAAQRWLKLESSERNVDEGVRLLNLCDYSCSRDEGPAREMHSTRRGQIILVSLSYRLCLFRTLVYGRRVRNERPPTTLRAQLDQRETVRVYDRDMLVIDIPMRGFTG